MLLLKAQAGAVADGSAAVDLGQTPGALVVLSAADTELASLATARAALAKFLVNGDAVVHGHACLESQQGCDALSAGVRVRALQKWRRRSESACSSKR